MSYNASSTYKSFLMHSTDGSAYTMVIDIKDFPDLGGTPETIDTTTLTDAMRTSVLGIQEAENFVFNANYDPTQFQSVVALATADQTAPSYYAVWFGGTDVAGSDPTPTGNLGKFSFKGTMAKPFVTGGGVNEARSMQLTIAPASPVSFSTGE
ncbi:phage tail protein [bacterium]|nr:phage tail protein [bacterium]